MNKRSIEIYECISDIYKKIQDMKTKGDGFAIMSYNYNSQESEKAHQLWVHWFQVDRLLFQWFKELQSQETNHFNTTAIFKSTFETAKYQLREPFPFYKTYETLLQSSISICQNTSKLNFSESKRSLSYEHDIVDDRSYSTIKKMWSSLSEDLNFIQRTIQIIKKQEEQNERLRLKKQEEQNESLRRQQQKNQRLQQSTHSGLEALLTQLKNL